MEVEVLMRISFGGLQKVHGFLVFVYSTHSSACKTRVGLSTILVILCPQLHQGRGSFNRCLNFLSQYIKSQLSVEPDGSLPCKFKVSGTLLDVDCYIYHRFDRPYCRHLQDQTLLEFLQQHCRDKFKFGVQYRDQNVFQVVPILNKRNPVHTALSHVKYPF